MLWRRGDGKMPAGRVHLLDNKALRIEHVTAADEGIYICEAENDVGSASARVSLTVHSPPYFTVRPNDVRPPLGGTVTLPCSAEGSPPPSVFWSREGSRLLLFPGSVHGHIAISADGTLTMHEVTREDSGYFVCSALSVAGSATERALVEVVPLQEAPPPIIQLGPSNQTLPVQSVAVLPCQAAPSSGADTAPQISWMKDGVALVPSGGRIAMSSRGSLSINNLQPSDSGEFTCKATSSSGESTWSAWLTVVAGLPEARRGPDPASIPPAPPRPIIVNATRDSITVSWADPNPGRYDHTHLIGYRLEYFSASSHSKGWIRAAKGIKNYVYTVMGLQPDSSYVFVVRAESSAGLSLPSPVSDTGHTLNANTDALPPYESAAARAQLSTNVVVLRDAQPLTSTSIRLIWDIVSANDYIEGFYIRYRELPEGSSESGSVNDSMPTYQYIKLMNSGSTSYTLSTLRKDTMYEIFMAPFYKSIDGQPSNFKVVSTLEDVPSAAPEHIQVGMLNVTSAFVRWTPPPPDHHHGKIIGYKIQISTTTGKLLAQMTLNATNMSVLLNNLTTGAEYMTRVAAFTKVGLGPYSMGTRLVMDPTAVLTLTPRSRPAGDASSVVRETWFAVLMGAMALALAGGFVGMLYLKKRQAASKELGHLKVPVVNANDMAGLGLMSGKETLWIDRGWRSGAGKEAPTTPTLGSEYAEVDAACALSSFYRQPQVSGIPDQSDTSDPTPYATTMLLSQLPGQPSDHMEETATPDLYPTASLMYQRKSPVSPGAPSTIDCSYTDEALVPLATGFERRAAQPPHWSEILPPPPDQPPPPPGPGPGHSSSGSICSPQLTKRPSCSTASRSGSTTGRGCGGSNGGTNGRSCSWQRSRNGPCNGDGQGRYFSEPPQQRPPPVPRYPTGYEPQIAGPVSEDRGCQSSLLSLLPDGSVPNGGSMCNGTVAEYGSAADCLLAGCRSDYSSDHNSSSNGRPHSMASDTCCSCSDSSCMYAEVSHDHTPSELRCGRTVK